MTIAKISLHCILNLHKYDQPKQGKIFDLVKSGVNKLFENNVNGFKKIKLIYGKRQPPNLRRILTIFFIYKSDSWCNHKEGANGVNNLYLKASIHLKILVDYKT